MNQRQQERVADLGYDPEFGARPLKRAIQSSISVPISQHLLQNPEDTTITVGVKNNKITIS